MALAILIFWDLFCLRIGSIAVPAGVRGGDNYILYIMKKTLRLLGPGAFFLFREDGLPHDVYDSPCAI